MSLATGTRLEHYEILSAIGTGGMGEVYCARDTKLGRNVAFKVLREVLDSDPNRLSRFRNEAQLLASLNHPNIAQIYGVVEVDHTRGIVMELVQGETLQTRLKRAALPVEEALQIAKQIAEALEAAHDGGIIHRDLKPGNIMLTTAGTVKVLDFGLAKALDTPASATDLSNSPTIVASITQPNVLIGTVAYMSPEQIRGHVADSRCDVWAFGCVLYEMLTGKPAFTGETITDLISGIIGIEPDWNALPTKTSPAVRSMVRRCLDKDRRRRFHAIGDARIALEEAQALPPATPLARLKTRERISWIIATIGLAAVGLLLRAAYFVPLPAERLVSRFAIEFPPEAPLGPGGADPFPSVSPDGQYVAFRSAGSASTATWRLWLRPLGSLNAQLVAGTEGINGYSFWSPDSRFIGFFAGGKLKKVAVAGGPPQILCDGSGPSATWNQDDLIIFDQQGSLHRVSAAGGVSTAIRTPDKSKHETGYRLPSFLPDGRHFVYISSSTDQGRTEVRAGSLDSSDDKSLFAANSRILYAHPGYLLFVRDGTLMAQPFDASKVSLKGDVFPVAERIGFNPNNGNGAFGVSQNGTLVYRVAVGPTSSELTWFDRTGKKLGIVKSTGSFVGPNLAPDQNRVAVQTTSSPDIWLIDLLRGTNSRFTFDPADDIRPVFSGNGKQILFVSNRAGSLDLYVKSADGVGAEQLLAKRADGVSDWSADGKVVLYAITPPNGTGFDIWALPMTGDKKPYPVLNSSFTEMRAKFSPDSRWMAYTSNESGRNEIYVQPFPPSGGKWQVSVDGGEYAYWRRDGKEIIFGTLDGKIMAADVKLGATFDPGVPRQLFQLPGRLAGERFAITADAQRFLVPLVPQAQDRPMLTTVLNWTADIKK